MEQEQNSLNMPQLDQDWADFIERGAKAMKDHRDKLEIVRKLIERDIVNGRPAVEIAQAVLFLQRGENMIYEMYRK